VKIKSIIERALSLIGSVDSRKSIDFVDKKVAPRMILLGEISWSEE